MQAARVHARTMRISACRTSSVTSAPAEVLNLIFSTETSKPVAATHTSKALSNDARGC
jgi:hypothetical protein